MVKLALSVLTVSTLLAGCVVGPNYEAPRTTLPASFHQGDHAVFSAESPDARWWANFRDPVLAGLVADALARNPDLRLARARLAEARALRRSVAWDFAPHGGGVVDQQRGRLSDLESEGRPRGTAETWSGGFDAIWELDVFGRTRRTAERATAEVGAVEATLRDVQVALLAEVGANYFGLRHAEEAVRLLERQTAALRESHAITLRRFEAGRGTLLDSARTESLLRETEALLPDATRLVNEHQHRLAVLVGVVPGSLALPASSSPTTSSDTVRVGAPADLLGRRPDVQAAERRLAAAMADVGISTAALFPEVSVQGFFRFVGLTSADLGQAGTRSWGVAPTIRWRFLDHGRLRAQLAASRARADGSLAQYEQTALRALEETENAFARYAAALTRLELLVARHTAAERARAIADRLDAAGGADPLARLEAERTALVAARDVLTADTERQLALIAVYQALGGGWEEASVAAR